MIHQRPSYGDGSNYPFHQCEVVSNSEPVCPIWRKERCPLLHFRNVDMQLRRCTTPCFWENQPAGCVKISCSYFHCKPRNINGLFLPPTSSSNTTLYPVLPFVPPPSTPTPPPPLQHCEDMVSITESSIVDTMIKAYTPERAESCRCIEDLQIKQENLCRPIHPPLIIHLTVTEDDEEEEEDAEDKCFDYCEPRTKTPEEIEEERTIMEICGKAGDYYKVQISHEIHSIISPISQEVKIKLQKPLDTARDLQEGDGLAVPTKLDLERKRNLTLSSIEYPNEYIKTNIGYFAKGGGDCYVPQQNMYNKQKSNSFTRNIQQKASKCQDFKEPHRPKVKNDYHKQRWNHNCPDLEICCYSNTSTQTLSFNYVLHMAPQVKNNPESITTTSTGRKFRDNPPKTVNDNEHSNKGFKRIKNKKWRYEEQKSSIPQVKKNAESVQVNSKHRTVSQRSGEGNSQIKSSYSPPQKGKARNIYQNTSLPNTSPVSGSNWRPSNVEESSYYSRNQSWPNGSSWRKRMQNTATPTKQDKLNYTNGNNSTDCDAPAWRKKAYFSKGSPAEQRHIDNYNPSNYSRPAWKKKERYSKQDAQVEQKHTEHRRHGSM